MGHSQPGVCAKVAGQACTANSDCGTGFCADGVCCNSACTAQCAACDVAGNVGTCIAVVGSPHGSRSACSGTGTCGARCNGSDATACHYPDATSTCGSPSCTAGVQTAAGYCDGAGGCKQVSASCGAYTCKGTSCGTACATDSECATGNYCKSGVCSPREPAGVACTSATSCSTGFCVDGVCCGSAACSDSARCDVTGALGKCSKPAGGSAPWLPIAAVAIVSTECAAIPPVTANARHAISPAARASARRWSVPRAARALRAIP